MRCPRTSPNGGSKLLTNPNELQSLPVQHLPSEGSTGGNNNGSGEKKMLPQSKEGIVGATEPGVFANAPPKNMTNATMAGGAKPHEVMP